MEDLIVHGRKFIFQEGDGTRKNPAKYVFDRLWEQNQADIIECASLALHKALIGLSELSLLEECKPALRQSIAVHMYGSRRRRRKTHQQHKKQGKKVNELYDNSRQEVPAVFHFSMSRMR